MWGGPPQGPMVVPGVYRLVLQAGEARAEGSLEVVRDPRLAVSDADLQRRFELLMAVRDKLSQAHEAILAIRAAREQVDAWVERAAGHPAAEALKTEAAAIKDAATVVEESLIQTKAKSSQDVLNFPVRLNAKLSDIGGVIESAPGLPPQQAVDTFEALAAATDEACRRWEDVVAGPLATFASHVRDAQLPLIHLAGSTSRTGMRD